MTDLAPLRHLVTTRILQRVADLPDRTFLVTHDELANILSEELPTLVAASLKEPEHEEENEPVFPAPLVGPPMKGRLGQPRVRPAFHAEPDGEVAASLPPAPAQEEDEFTNAEIQALRTDFEKFLEGRNVTPEVLALVMPWKAARVPVLPQAPALEAALEEYRASCDGLPRNMAVGWIDDFQKSYRRYVAASNELLRVAALPAVARAPHPEPPAFIRACPRCHEHEETGGVIESTNDSFLCCACGHEYETPERWTKLDAADARATPAPQEEP